MVLKNKETEKIEDVKLFITKNKSDHTTLNRLSLEVICWPNSAHQPVASLEMICWSDST